jgi:hypothetical protein
MLSAIPPISPTSPDANGRNRLIPGPLSTPRLLPPVRLQEILQAFYGPQWRRIASERLSVSPRTIERWVAGVHNPPRHKLILLRDQEERQVQEVEAAVRQAQQKGQMRIAAIRESGLWLKGALNRTPSPQLRTRGQN